MAPARSQGDRRSRVGYYLDARYELVEGLAADVRTDAQQADHTPGWARALVEPPSPEIVAQIELWRAAHQVPDNDLRPHRTRPTPPP